MIEERPLLITLDTGVLDECFDEIKRAASALPVDVDYAIVTVADRERGEDESRPDDLPTIIETAVLGEWRLGMAVLGSDESAALFKQILHIISGGSLKPPPGDDYESEGDAHQVRDAMMLEAHVREGRDVFITTDAKAFINHGRREKLEALCSTKIVHPGEFIEWCGVYGQSA